MDFKKNIMLAVLFITGIWSFISGQHIISSAVFGSATVISHLARKNIGFKY